MLATYIMVNPPSPPRMPPIKTNRGTRAALEAEGFGQTMNVEGRKSVGAAESRLVHLGGGGDDFVGVVEFRQQAVDGRLIAHKSQVNFLV